VAAERFDVLAQRAHMHVCAVLEIDWRA
jgi:hypothetical protein